MLVSEFISGGGIQVHKEPVIDEAPFASYLLTTLGQRAVEVKVGDYQGALVWADPDSKGIRTHNLYWSDGEYNYALIADLSAQATLNMTRILVCGS